MNINEAMYIDNVFKKYRNGDYENKSAPVFSLRKYREGHIFDEDKSVKWNREELERKNQENIDKQKFYRDESARLHEQLNRDIVAAIMYEYDFNEEQAQIINGYAYEKHHSSGYYEILNCLNDICNVFEKFENARKEKK